ncbi:MAG TPA: 50S ribosomal protein L24 [Anaerolineales bacterium]|nr:50S ribosomal protein L24 [Anaerolineales bacterium]
MKAKIKKGDHVEVIGGADKGTRGEVIKVLPKTSQIVVQGINLRKKHQRQVQSGGRTLKPGIIEFEGPLDYSNVMIVCSSCDAPSRIGIKREEGEATRVCKRCGADLG